MIIIQIATQLGTDLRTRSFFRTDIDRLIPRNEQAIVDFTGVTFISRSVADEIYNVTLDYPDVAVRGMRGEVEQMFNVVVSGRNSPRHYSDVRVHPVKLLNMKELSDFFMAM